MGFYRGQANYLEKMSLAGWLPGWKAPLGPKAQNQ